MKIPRFLWKYKIGFFAGLSALLASREVFAIGPEADPTPPILRAIFDVAIFLSDLGFPPIVVIIIFIFLFIVILTIIIYSGWKIWRKMGFGVYKTKILRFLWRYKIGLVIGVLYPISFLLFFTLSSIKGFSEEVFSGFYFPIELVFGAFFFLFPQEAIFLPSLKFFSFLFLFFIVIGGVVEFIIKKFFHK